MGFDAATARLYAIPDPGFGATLEEQARMAVEGGAGAIQLRLKETPESRLMETGRAMAAACRKGGALFIVNDRPDIALALGADGVHVGGTDASPAEARRMLPAGAVVGVSVGDPGEAVAAEAAGADYVAIGPVFATPVKAGLAPVGLGMVTRVRQAVSIPVVAIGGIGAANAASVVAAGADSIAVITAVFGAKDPRAAAAGLLSIIRTAVQNRSA
jgi:thiamine-phosphate pyrophosphorylase